jgi:hypothetical protein
MLNALLWCSDIYWSFTSFVLKTAQYLGLGPFVLGRSILGRFVLHGMFHTDT